MLNIFVLIKQVPKTSNLEIDNRTGALIREDVENIINPDDVYALELGLNLKEQYGGTVTAVTMGPSQANIALRECLAMGLDRAIIVCDPVFANSDTLQTALVLKETFESIKNYDIIITGSETADSSTGQVPFQLSEALQIPLITDIFSYSIENRVFKCYRNFGHEAQNIEVELPILIRVRRHYNEPRSIPLLGIKKAFDNEIGVTDFNALGCPESVDGRNKSPTKVVKTEKIVFKRKNQIIEGAAKEKVKTLIDIMKEHGIEKIWTGKKK